jgi:hypothetical protein
MELGGSTAPPAAATLVNAREVGPLSQYLDNSVDIPILAHIARRTDVSGHSRRGARPAARALHSDLYDTP